MSPFTDFTDYSTDVFTEGTGTDQYDRVNAEIVRMDAYSFRDIILVFTINPSRETTSPAQLVDTQSHAVVQNIPLWHPAISYHYSIAAHNIDLQLATDPAQYQVSLTNAVSNVWNQTNVDTVWLDTNMLGYLPYYDDRVYPNINNRLYSWGKQAPWSSIKVYKWIKSTVLPSGWSAKVTADATNSAIIQSLKATGSPRQTVFRRTRTAYPSAWSAWERHSLIRDKLHAVIDVAIGNQSTLNLVDVLWRDGDVAQVYQNGVLVTTAIINSGVATLAVSIAVTELDIIDVIRQIRTVTSTETAFNPDVSDDHITNIQWKQDCEYTSVIETTGSLTTGLISTPYYYFWLEGSTNTSSQDSTKLSTYATAIQLDHMPTPYFVVQKPKDDPTMLEEFGYGIVPYGTTFAAGTSAEQFFIVPVLYRQAILRNVASYITDDDRYVARFTRDFTLRDNVLSNGKNINLKDVHEEWAIFREKQLDVVSVVLWNKLTEALIGYSISDATIRVPALERELYDIVNNTDTRFGLGAGQAFVDKALAVTSIMVYLQNPNNDFYPVDLDRFFSLNNFDTPVATQAAMLEIYNTFPSNHVNAMWFSTLQDALTTKAKYKGLMKTSWVSLHGIRVLSVGGQFDD
jgi:hypothetical protein